MVIGDIIRRTAAKYPNKRGVIFEGKEFIWQEVNDRVNKLSNALLRIGLKKGDRVAILSRSCNEYLEYYFATAKVGLIAVPLNTRLLGNELSYMLNDTKARALFVGAENIDKVKTIPNLEGIEYFVGIGQRHPYCYDFETLVRDSPANEPEISIDDENIFLILYTSGTEGRPKGAIWSHKSSTYAIETIASDWRTKYEDIYLFMGVMFFAVLNRLMPVFVGNTVCIINFEPLKALQTIEKEKITATSSGPAQLSMLVNHPEIDKYDLSSLRFYCVGGSPASPELLKKATQVLGAACLPEIALTESCCIGCMLQPEDFELEGPLAKRLASVGRPMKNVNLRIVDENGKDIASDGKQIGEIIMKGDFLFKGYWGMPQESAEAIKDGWFYTGDIATRDEDGFIYIADRKRDMIKSGGMQIWPREVEDVICKHPAVLHVAVISVPDERWGETPKAVIMLKPSAKASEEEIIELCKTNLASYKKPTSVDFVDTLPMTGSGKILKRELREKYWKAHKRKVI